VLKQRKISFDARTSESFEDESEELMLGNNRSVASSAD
jgi:hypothetical protein